MTEQELRELICHQFLQGDTDFPIERDADLLEEGICDSLGLVKLAAALEKRVAGLKVHDQEVNRENLGSIANLEAFLRRKTS